MTLFHVPDHVDALLGHPMAEDALDAAVVAEVALGGDEAASLVGIRPRVVVQLRELHFAPVAALDRANEKFAPCLSAGPVASSHFSNLFLFRELEFDLRVLSQVFQGKRLPLICQCSVTS